MKSFTFNNLLETVYIHDNITSNTWYNKGNMTHKVEDPC